LVLHFSGRFLLIAFLRQRRESMYNYLFTVAIPVNYTIVFRECLKILCIYIYIYIYIYISNNLKRRNLFHDYLRVSLLVSSSLANKVTHLNIRSSISYSIIKFLSNLNETVVIRVLKSTALFKIHIPLKLSWR